MEQIHTDAFLLVAANLKLKVLKSMACTCQNISKMVAKDPLYAAFKEICTVGKVTENECVKALIQAKSSAVVPRIIKTFPKYDIEDLYLQKKSDVIEFIIHTSTSEDCCRDSPKL